MKTIALFAAAATLALAGTASAATYAPTGPQNDVALSTVTDGGWTMIYRGAYRDSVSIADLLGGAQEYVMLGAINNATGILDVLAWATLADVTTVTAWNTTHEANGAEWYFNSSSMGFAGEGDTIYQQSADTNGSCWMGGEGCVAERDRLSWHTSGWDGAPSQVNGGWRSGSNIWLNDSTAFDRVVFTTNSLSAVPEPGTWALMIAGFGMAGVALRRRQVAVARI